MNAGRFSLAWVQQESTPKNTGRQNRAVTDRYYSTTGERSRAREGAENKIQTWKPGLDDQLAARSGLRAIPTLRLRVSCIWIFIYACLELSGLVDGNAFPPGGWKASARTSSCVSCAGR